MSVRRTKNGSGKLVWFVDVAWEHPDGRVERIRKVSPVQTRKGAEAYERQLRNALGDGSYQQEAEAKAIPTFAEFAARFMESYAAGNNKRSEVLTKESILTHGLLPFFGTMRLDTIGPEVIERYKAQVLAKKLSKKTLKNHLTVLQKVLRTAEEWEVLTKAPKVRSPKVSQGDFDFLTFEEADALVEVMEPGWKAMVQVALHTGLRLGELMALQWDDLDFERGLLTVSRRVYRGEEDTPKSGKGRVIPLNQEVLEALQSHPRHLRCPYVFYRGDGEQLTEPACRKPLERGMRKAGIVRMRRDEDGNLYEYVPTWHPLRHTFASHLVMLGAPMKAVQELMGHATIQMTMRYAHLSPDAREAAVRLLATRRSSGNVTATGS